MRELKRLLWAMVLLLLDLAVLYLTFSLALQIRMEILPRISPDIFTIRTIVFLDRYYWLIVIWPIIFLYEGLYKRPITFWYAAWSMVKANTVAMILILVFISLTQSWDISRSVVALTWGLGLVLFPASRYVFNLLVYHWPLFRSKVVLYGAGLTGKAVLEGLAKHPELGMDIIGFIDDDPERVGKVVGSFHGRDVAVIGHAPEFLAGPKAREADEIIISISHITRERLIKAMEVCNEVVDTVKFIPDIFGTAIHNASIERVDTALIMSFEQKLSRPSNRLVKRVFDLVFSSLGIVILSPLWLVVYLSIRTDSSGRVLFEQGRLAQGGGGFNLYKYRSMYSDGDRILSDLLESSPTARQEWETYKKLKNDPRVTRVGRFIRKWSIDELPQLFNVFWGEMSIVGPRPYLPREVDDMGGYKDLILKAKPGITGLWQVSGRNNLTFEDRLRLDAFYVRNWSLWGDISVLFKTIPALIRRGGAY